MNKNIIDDIHDLMRLSEDELTEALLNEKYNKANLRELVRRSLGAVREYKKAFEYERSENERMREGVEIFKIDLNDL